MLPCLLILIASFGSLAVAKKPVIAVTAAEHVPPPTIQQYETVCEPSCANVCKDECTVSYGSKCRYVPTTHKVSPCSFCRAGLIEAVL